MPIEEAEDRLTLGESAIPGAGRGVFAKVPLAVGEVLRVLGVLICPGSVEDACTSFADAYKFRVGDQLLIPIGFGGMINHSATFPNLEKIVEGSNLLLRVIRPIQAGDELLFCYSDYAQQRFGLK